MYLISFTGYLRFDELACIRRRDLIFDKYQVKINIRSGKTDQFNKGQTVVIARTEKLKLASIPSEQGLQPVQLSVMLTNVC